MAQEIKLSFTEAITTLGKLGVVGVVGTASIAAGGATRLASSAQIAAEKDPKGYIAKSLSTPIFGPEGIVQATYQYGYDGADKMLKAVDISSYKSKMPGKS